MNYTYFDYDKSVDRIEKKRILIRKKINENSLQLKDYLITLHYE